MIYFAVNSFQFLFNWVITCAWRRFISIIIFSIKNALQVLIWQNNIISWKTFFELIRQLSWFCILNWFYLLCFSFYGCYGGLRLHNLWYCIIKVWFKIFEAINQLTYFICCCYNIFITRISCSLHWYKWCRNLFYFLGLWYS